MYKVIDRSARDDGKAGDLEHSEPDPHPGSHAVSWAPAPLDPLATVWRRKGMIALAAVAGAVALIAAGQLLPVRYNAVAQILIDPSELRIIDNGLRAQSPFNEALIAEVETQTRVLLSGNVLARVVAEQNLDRDPEFTDGRAVSPLDLLRGLARSIGLGTPSESGPPDLALAAQRSLEKRVSARRTERTYVVDLGVGTESREKSVRIANAIVDAFLAEQTAAQSEAAKRATEMLSARLDDLRTRALEAEERVEAFKRENDILAAGDHLVIEQQVTTISDQVMLARTRAAEARARFKQIETLRKSGGDIGAISEATGSQTLAALRAQHSAAARREAELAATLKPKHPALFQAQQQTRKIAGGVDAEIRRIAEATSREYQRAEGSEASLEKSLREVKGDLTRINAKIVALRELERDAAASRGVYEAFLKRTQEVGEQGKLPITNTRVISRATPPEHRALPPSKALLGLGGLMLGGMVGVLLAFVPAYRGRRDPEAA